MVLVKLLAHIVDALTTMLHMVVGLPTLELPRRFWARVFGNRGRAARLALALLPWAIMGLVAGISHYTYLVQTHPSILPDSLLGQSRAHIAALVRVHRTEFFAAKHLWQQVWVAVILALDSNLPSVAAISMGAFVWAAILLCSTLALAPLHMAALEPAWRKRLGQPLEDLALRALQAPNALWRGLAQRQAWWFVGTASGGMPLFVPVAERRQTWVLGGTDRKSNATPMMQSLRSAVLAGRPVVLIDTVASMALADQLRAYAAEANRLRAFRIIDVAAAPTPEEEQELFAQAHRSGGILYVGLPLQQQAADQIARARTLMGNLAAAIPATPPRQGALVVGLQDAAELPGGCVEELLKQGGAQVVLAQQRCDAAAMSLPAQHNKGAAMLVLAPSRKAEAQILAQALGRANKAGNAPLTANMVRDLRWREGVFLQDGTVVQGLVRIDTPPKRSPAAGSAPPGDAALN